MNEQEPKEIRTLATQELDRVIGGQGIIVMSTSRFDGNPDTIGDPDIRTFSYFNLTS
jgi:hypothetical protein